jgi:hypothetical protein
LVYKGWEIIVSSRESIYYHTVLQKGKKLIIGLDFNKRIHQRLLNKLTKDQVDLAHPQEGDRNLLEQAGLITRPLNSDEILYFYGILPKPETNKPNLYEFFNLYFQGDQMAQFGCQVIELISIHNKKQGFNYDNSWVKKGKYIITLTDGTWTVKLRSDNPALDENLNRLEAGQKIIVSLSYNDGKMKGVRLLEVLIF